MFRIFLVTLILSIMLSFEAIEIQIHNIFLNTKNDGDISVEPNITQVKQNLESHGFVLIPGKDMKKLLIQHGASEDDLAVLESGSGYIHKHLPIDQQPAMYHVPPTGMCGFPEN